MLRLKCLSALRSIKCQIAILDQPPPSSLQFTPETIQSFDDKSLIYDPPRRRKGRSRPKVMDLAKAGGIDLPHRSLSGFTLVVLYERPNRRHRSIAQQQPAAYGPSAKFDVTSNPCAYWRETGSLRAGADRRVGVSVVLDGENEGLAGINAIWIPYPVSVRPVYERVS